MKDLLVATEAIVIGIVTTMLIFWLGNKIVEALPSKLRKALQPWVFIGPVVILISLFLIYPTVQSIRLSFMEEAIDGSTSWVGLNNYQDIFGDAEFRTMLVNNLMWIAIVPIVVVSIGLAIAQLANNVGPKREKFFKSAIFMPMAISFVSAATIWRLIYSYIPEGQSQTGLLNAIWTAFGGTPQTWLQLEGFKLNNIFLMVIFIWLNVGFAMVLMSAAIKAVPEDTIEAGRMDGASARQLFFRIVLPQIWGTALSVFITVLIGAMKIFDIVLAMTGGNYNTNVLAQNFYNEYFIYGNTGRAMATVVVLIAIIAPVMAYQVRHYRKMDIAR
jgi:alpha-glucoside transport system permease protein